MQEGPGAVELVELGGDLVELVAVFGLKGLVPLLTEGCLAVEDLLTQLCAFLAALVDPGLHVTEGLVQGVQGRRAALSTISRRIGGGIVHGC